MTRIGYGQIGVAHAHASKLNVYQASTDYQVIGVVEDDPDLRSAAAQQPAYRDVNWMTREELLNQPGLQVVGVETRVRDLLDTAEQCIAADMHIHLDKPAGSSLPQFQRLLDAAARKHLTVQMGYMYRYNPAIVMLRDFLKRGWLGEPFEVHAVMSKSVDDGTRRELAEFRGGSMFELGCHLIDLVIGVLGRPDRVQAFPRHSADSDDALLDNMLAVLEYPTATATVRSSVTEIDGGARRHFVLCGSEGTFHIQPLDSPSARLALRDAHGEYKRGYQDVTFPRFDRYIDDAADLAKIVRHEKDTDFSYQHDLTVQRVVLQASTMSID